MLTLFGLAACAAMLIFYEVEHWHPRFILWFAAACVAAAVYAVLQGAWPFALLEGFWCGVAVKRWRRVTGR